MGIFSRFENKAEDVIEGSGGRGRGGIEPVKLAKRACKEMEHEKMIGVGHEYAPTLYNILVSPEDDAAMSGYYPSLAGEIETYLTGQGAQRGLVFDCPPLARFIVDDGLRRGKFDIIAESVSPAIIAELRHEEMVRYGIEPDYDNLDNFDFDRSQSHSRNQQPQGADFPADDGFAGEPFANDFDEPLFDAPAPMPSGTPAPGPDAFANDVVDNAADDAVSDAAPADQRTVILNEPMPQQPQAVLYNLKTQRVYQLRDDRTVVGRDTNCDVIIGDPSVSRHHAEVLHNDSGWLIRDTGSTNGMIVNGIATTQSRIYDGDIIDLGTTQLEFQEG
ncbi:MAG: hypothetical protein DBY20_06205 [Coriobacteriia bacterium]|nr:MAG: hypothetical protein DBY20_06205 [Coriobacteriia bacterium]